MTQQEAESLVYSLDKGLLGKEWALEGYDRQNRVQRYPRDEVVIADEFKNNDDDGSLSNDNHLMEESFGWLFDRIMAAVPPPKQGSSRLKHRPYEVIVTEHTPSSCRSVVDVFEQRQLCPCKQHGRQCTCYIAQVTLVNDAIQLIEKPERRDLECWDVALPIEQHSTEMIMEANGVIIKMGDSLWNWRGRILDVEEKTSSEESSVAPTEDSDGNSDVLSGEMKKLEVVSKSLRKKAWTPGTKKLKTLNRRSIVISFRAIHPSPVTVEDKVDDAGDDAELLSQQQQALKTLPLSELLTIIVTTSPIRSNPSTEMLEHTFDTFRFAGEEFAFDCKKVIVCDGCRVVEEAQCDAGSDTNTAPKIRIYANGKQNLRNGVATLDQSKNYQEFKNALRKLCEDANNSDDSARSPFMNTTVVELEERHGYGFALRHALRHCVNTPYVCVIQHDRNFMRNTPVREVVNAIISNPRIKYVGMNMKSNLMYYDIFCGKYGKRAMDEFRTLILRPKELCIAGNIYGPDGDSYKSMPAPANKHRSKTLQTLRDGYKGSHQNLNHLDWMKLSELQDNSSDGCSQLSLTPTLFWYDNTHIVETSHYRDFILNPKYKMVARGGFVEDKLSPVITRNVERMGLKEGHAKFGCYLLDDHCGMYFTGHLDGGSYKTAHLYKKDVKCTSAT